MIRFEPNEFSFLGETQNCIKNDKLLKVDVSFDWQMLPVL